MTSMQNNLPAQYRVRAEEARTKAEAAQDEKTRQRLLNDADMWERMAAYEEQHGPRLNAEERARANLL